MFKVSKKGCATTSDRFDSGACLINFEHIQDFKVVFSSLTFGMVYNILGLTKGLFTVRLQVRLTLEAKFGDDSLVSPLPGQ